MRHHPAAGYDDTQALNDIHALLANPARPAPHDALRDLASILARIGRASWPSGMITAVVGDDAHGMPVARIDADMTQVFIHPNGPGLLIHLAPRDQVDADAPEISVAGTGPWRSAGQGSAIGPLTCGGMSRQWARTWAICTRQ